MGFQLLLHIPFSYLYLVLHTKYHTIAYGINPQIYHTLTLLLSLKGDTRPTLVEAQ